MAVSVCAVNINLAVESASGDARGFVMNLDNSTAILTLWRE